mmetsp:Transcript_41903/g.127077  ORF Transcript_41903/g.127077 Transcript_41903/m.127077 type:complete len:343 (-) Transcript_41903:290-1318(-)
MVPYSFLPLAAAFSIELPTQKFKLANNIHVRPTLRTTATGSTQWNKNFGFLPRSSIALRSSGRNIDEESTCEVSFEDIKGLPVVATSDDEVPLGSLLTDDPNQTTVLACLSHFGDFNAWEVTQQYITAVKDGLFGSNCNFVLVGIGSAEAARQFESDLSLKDPSIDKVVTLVADENGAVTDALDCYKGWLVIDKKHANKWPATDVSPYIKLLGMIVGLGSPGTIEKVIYGYVGDQNGSKRSRKWVVDALLQGSKQGRWPRIAEEAFEGIPDESGLRPFELATLRAQNGLHIVLNWGKLGPQDGDLFTRMGGTFVFRGEDIVYSYFDKGILTYAPQDDVITAS